MRLPRRVPWASIAELDEVCAWIYSDEIDIEAKVLAVNRLAAWKFITQLPHALESTLAILSAIVQDASSQSSTSLLSLRQSYATAIIRLVNGLVDPLQLGAYARSISSIAAQLGLPLWLVELRHAATHEDLPSIEVLREATREAMAWLLSNYFLPSLNPSAPPPPQVAQLSPLAPLLKQYKGLLKTTTRDASLRTQYKPEITKVLRSIERWMSEVKVAANVSDGAFEWDVGGDGEDADEIDIKEKLALDKFCDSLLEKGILVPQSKKKRAVTPESFNPPPSSVQIWSPLISHVESLHSSLPIVLVSKIIAHLLSEAGSSESFIETDTIPLNSTDSKRDISYDLCLASWAKWLVETYGSEEDNEDDEQPLKREDVVISIINGLGPLRGSPLGNDKAARSLLKALCSGYPTLQEVSTLLSVPQTIPSSVDWNENDLDAMSQRLESILARRRNNSPDNDDAMIVDTQRQQSDPQLEQDLGLPLGWRKLSERDGWKPSPIGVWVGVV